MAKSMYDNYNKGSFITGIGAFIAAFLSYAINGSFWWSVLHLFCGWVYIAYALIFRWHDVIQNFK